MGGTPLARQAVGVNVIALFAPLGRKQFLGELGWAALGAPLTAVGLVGLLAGLIVGVALSPIFVGILVLSGVLLGARRLGSVHRQLAGTLLDIEVSEPPMAELKPGLWNWFKTRLGDRAGWRVFGYLLIRFPLSLVNLSVAGALLVYGLGAFCYPVYWLATGGHMLPLFDIHASTWVLTLPIAAVGALILIALPRVLHGLTTMDRVLAYSLLGPRTLSERVRDLEESRASAIEDATDRLRRIERDLHDGAQAQLVAMAMKLGIAREELKEGNVENLDALLTTAHGNAKQALTELRDLARGIRPPALDAGLAVALSTLAAQSAVNVQVGVDLPDRPSPAIETLLYFSAAELVTNAAKHGRGADVRLDLTAQGHEIRLTVRDDGTGGARVSPGGGLAGVAERLGTVDGRLEIESPSGGPTVVTAHIPGG
ncbi:sensor histidine kinase [Amycolatopsis sp.]|uniref:sensor histidine kinase n=1 Tax=Amycolatopsis sp. TaxID=37632 RepID=UPI002CCAF8C5|nr:sensor domain-containing protein [Amycolatopsis sp.]HVV08846.1 sensor domain-containing protein [Amycolatopsis sp.]